MSGAGRVNRSFLQHRPFWFFTQAPTQKPTILVRWTLEGFSSFIYSPYSRGYSPERTCDLHKATQLVLKAKLSNFHFKKSWVVKERVLAAEGEDRVCPVSALGRQPLFTSPSLSRHDGAEWPQNSPPAPPHSLTLFHGDIWSPISFNVYSSRRRTGIKVNTWVNPAISRSVSTTPPAHSYVYTHGLNGAFPGRTEWYPGRLHRRARGCHTAVCLVGTKSVILVSMIKSKALKSGCLGWTLARPLASIQLRQVTCSLNARVSLYVIPSVAK